MKKCSDPPWPATPCENTGVNCPESGRLWLEDYHDRYIRDEAHHPKVVRYFDCQTRPSNLEQLSFPDARSLVKI